MIIDMHVHEKTYSKCSHMSLDDIIEKGKKIGLAGICITDHDSMGLSEMVYEYRKRAKDFLVLIGSEILTYEGDILIYGLNSAPKHRMHVSDLLDLVDNEGGVAIAAHPYRENARGLGDRVKKLEKLDGIEGLNGNTSYTNNHKAIEIARIRNEPFFGGSDAHVLENVGKYATKFFGKIRNEQDLITAIKKRNYLPVCYTGQKFEEFAEQ